MNFILKSSFFIIYKGYFDCTAQINLKIWLQIVISAAK